ncbi:hypothetical protein TSOC111612_21395 [Tsukamurella ocularis]|uniref:DUF7373 family lipoprotein n=1 Tax=Tsukamurella ocularis TaxID=1970234 RepID=UPI0039EE2C3C
MIPLVSAAVAIACCGGCGSPIEGTPVGDPSATPKLATGNFATTPAVIGDAATTPDAWLQESWRMADGVPTPWSIDPALTAAATGFVGLGLVAPVQLQSVENTKGIAVFSLGQMQTMYGIPFLGGFITAGADGTQSSKVSVGFLHYPDGPTARRAADALTENTPVLPAGFAALEGVRSLGVDRGPVSRVAAVLQDGENLLVAAGSAPTVERATELAGKALSTQRIKIRDYRPTQYSGIPPLRVPMDRDGVMSRILTGTGSPPEAYKQLGLAPNRSPFDGYRSIYAHTIANVAERDRLDRFATTFGVDLISVAEVPAFAVLYRTREPAAATLLIRDRIPDGELTSTVPGLASDAARCTVEEKTNRMTRCWVAWGRYAVTVGSGDPTLAKQAAAAQYSILRAAG